MSLLGVNIDHIATLRQARRVDYPDPIVAAKMAQDAGADQITCHLREDRRHIQDTDVSAIQSLIEIPLNLEMAVTFEMEAFALKHRPDKVTLVPERREELTTEGGLDVLRFLPQIQSTVTKLKGKGISVSLFIDPEHSQLKASLETGADAVEFHTGVYCNATGERQISELERLKNAVVIAEGLGFFIAAGHGLNYANILPVKRISAIKEFNIGHSIVAHAVLVGWERAVREMKALVS